MTADIRCHLLFISMKEQGVQKVTWPAARNSDPSGWIVNCEHLQASVALKSSVSFQTMIVPEIMKVSMLRNLKVCVGSSASVQPSDQNAIVALNATCNGLNLWVQDDLAKTEANLSAQVQSLESECLGELRALEICERRLQTPLHDMKTTLHMHNGTEGVVPAVGTFEKHFDSLIKILDKEDKEIENLTIRWNETQGKILQLAITMLSPSCLQDDGDLDQLPLRESIKKGTEAYRVSDKQVTGHQARLGALSERMKTLRSETSQKLADYQEVSISKVPLPWPWTHIQHRNRRFRKSPLSPLSKPSLVRWVISNLRSPDSDHTRCIEGVPKVSSEDCTELPTFIVEVCFNAKCGKAFRLRSTTFSSYSRK